MIRSVARTVVLVRDYEEAIAFWRDTMGFTMIADQAVGEHRFVHLGPAGQPGVGLWLMKARTEAQRARVGNQTGGEPLIVAYTDDCRTTAAELAARGVACTEPRETADAVVVHFEDLYGNEIVLVELTDAA